MYEVPRNQRPTQGLQDSHNGRCPTCGSRRFLPDGGLGMHSQAMPQAMQRYICADCGTRYRMLEPLPTWRDLAYDLVTYLAIFIVLAIVLVLLM